MGNKVRDKGHRWELTVLHSLISLFPNIRTSRNESYTEDAKCIDLCNTGNLAIQCKNFQSKPNFNEELSKIDSDKIKILAFKWNKIRGKNGEFAVLYWEDFVKLLESKNL